MTTTFKLNKRGDVEVESVIQTKPERKLSLFHAWLIKHRPYCEYRTCMEESTHVKNLNGKDETRCDFHAST